MEAATATGNAAPARGKRRHGSTAVFVAVDYAFLLAFAGFLSYLLVSSLLPTSGSAASF